MSRLDELPPDQRAALSLLLRQRKSYAEVAALLGISERAVHDRAHAALAVLAPAQARQLTPERRQDIGDYLLGQKGVAERLLTRSHLSSSEPSRAWAGALAAEIAPLASSPLPDIPAGMAPAAAGALGGGDRLSAPRADADVAGSFHVAPAGGSLPSSRLGGALLLGAIVVAVVVAVLLLSSGGSHAHNTRASTATGAATTSKAATSGPTVTQRIALHSPKAGSRSVGIVEVLSESGKRAFYIAAEHLPPSRGFFYAIWLYNSPHSSLPLSRSPAVGSNKRLAGGALLPSNAGEFREILLTRETSGHPTRPGVVVLRGRFSLGS
jgi:Sigma-70, region 4